MLAQAIVYKVIFYRMHAKCSYMVKEAFMKVTDVVICLNCNEVYVGTDHAVCPDCASAFNWPIHKFIKCLNISIDDLMKRKEDAKHKKEGSHSLQEEKPLVVGDTLYIGVVAHSIDEVAEIFSPCRKDEPQQRDCNDIRWPQASPDKSHHTDRVIGSEPCGFIGECNRVDASYSKDSKVPGVASFFERAKGPIHKCLCWIQNT